MEAGKKILHVGHACTGSLLVDRLFVCFSFVAPCGFIHIVLQVQSRPREKRERDEVAFTPLVLYWMMQI